MSKILLIIFTFLAHFGFAQSAGEKEILAIEQARFDAMVKADINRLNELISDDLYYIQSNGSVDTKESFIKGIEDGSRSYDHIEINEAKVRVYDNSAIINGICTYHRKNEKGQADNLKLKYTDVYIKKDDKWQMVTW
ncbi:hypothetical protein BH23BAC1_BH23BAC1_49810 [soil metagenome]